MGVIIDFRCGKSVGVDSDWVNFMIKECNGEDCSNGIVGGIIFNCHGHIRHPLG